MMLHFINHREGSLLLGQLGDALLLDDLWESKGRLATQEDMDQLLKERGGSASERTVQM